MKIGRLGQVEQLLKEALGRRRWAQIFSANDERNTRLGIVDDAGEMVGGWCILTSEDGVTDVFALAVEVSAIVFGPAGQTDEINRLFRVQPPAVGRIGLPLRIVGEAAARAGVAASRIAMRRRQ